MNSQSDVGAAMAQTLQSDAAYDLVKDWSEFALDASLDDGIFKDIPVVATIAGLAKLGLTVSDRILVNKLMKCLRPLGELPPELRRRMVQRLEADPRYGRRVGEHMIELLTRIDAHRKPVMVGRVFAAYLRQLIDTAMLHRLNNAVERLPWYEIAAVREFHDNTLEERLEINPVTLQALSDAGIATVHSGFGTLVYHPTAVCERFIALNLDRCSA